MCLQEIAAIGKGTIAAKGQAILLEVRLDADFIVAGIAIDLADGRMTVDKINFFDAAILVIGRGRAAGCRNPPVGVGEISK